MVSHASCSEPTGLSAIEIHYKLISSDSPTPRPVEWLGHCVGHSAGGLGNLAKILFKKFGQEKDDRVSRVRTDSHSEKRVR